MKTKFDLKDVVYYIENGEIKKSTINRILIDNKGEHYAVDVKKLGMEGFFWTGKVFKTIGDLTEELVNNFGE